MTDDAWVTTNAVQRTSSQTYHTDTSCHNLQAASDYRPARDDELDRFDECAECRGEEYRSSTNTNKSLYYTLCNKEATDPHADD